MYYTEVTAKWITSRVQAHLVKNGAAIIYGVVLRINRSSSLHDAVQTIISSKIEFSEKI
jgi:hypothetical protein